MNAERLEHPLFRAMMQLVVSTEQGHPEELRKKLAANVRAEIEAAECRMKEPT
jgi:hypothetical protein